MAATPGSPRIVIIEDEFFVAWHVQTMLLEMNLASETASDARSGVDLALAHQAELLLVDLNLGDGPDGIEAVRLIYERRVIPTIFITAHADETSLDRIHKLAPCAPILSKPVSPDILRATIRMLFPAT